MRLPSEVSIIGHSDIDESKLVVRIFPSQTPESFTLSLFTCERSAYPCLLGSFSVQRTTSVSAKRELDRHQAKGESLALVSDIQGYLLEGPSQNPPHQFTTLMWQQNDMIYTISFPASQGTSIQRMAISMAQGQLLYSNSRR